ncbi:hypothetical protein [Winogradskyella jejuensis]|uniref:Uncharacterized protein n=1 Tax=Winogradskyella jejuensis TaxID=1089305 RepID=A0A1M5KAP5_9FLAO|nr:hypothetical protein [Winogradskyella jejuensis]SHG49916.1 hypothetical protein SAMN05444148_0278 [Winogradskyella jejuensis]
MVIKKRVSLYIVGILVILTIPFLAMQFTNEVNWQLNDFVIAGLLLSATALSIEIVKHFLKNKTHKTILIAIIIIGLVLLWIEMAVGIFGSPIAGS